MQASGRGQRSAAPAAGGAAAGACHRHTVDWRPCVVVAQRHRGSLPPSLPPEPASTPGNPHRRPRAMNDAVQHCPPTPHARLCVQPGGRRSRRWRRALCGAPGCATPTTPCPTPLAAGATWRRSSEQGWVGLGVGHLTLQQRAACAGRQPEKHGGQRRRRRRCCLSAAAAAAADRLLSPPAQGYRGRGARRGHQGPHV